MDDAYMKTVPDVPCQRNYTNPKRAEPVGSVDVVAPD